MRASQSNIRVKGGKQGSEGIGVSMAQSICPVLEAPVCLSLSLSIARGGRRARSAGGRRRQASPPPPAAAAAAYPDCSRAARAGAARVGRSNAPRSTAFDRRSNLSSLYCA